MIITEREKQKKRHQNTKMSRNNKSVEKEEKATEEESQASIVHKSILIEGTCY